jgi:hypothetical protein
MARQTLTVQQFAKTAFLAPTFAAVTGTGVQWQNTGKEKLAVLNGATASTATINLPPGYAGQAVTPFTAPLPTSNALPQYLGPFDRAFNQADGNIYIDLSSVTGVTVALLQDPGVNF